MYTIFVAEAVMSHKHLFDIIMTKSHLRLQLEVSREETYLKLPHLSVQHLF